MDPVPEGVTADPKVVTVTAHTEEVRMTPEQLDIVATTARTIEVDRARVAEAFYGRLFEISPASRELFPDDMAVQKAKLVDEVEFLAAATAEVHEAWTRLYRLIAETMIDGASHDLFAGS